MGHHRRYHKKDLVRIAQLAKLNVDCLSYYDSLGFFVALMFKLIKPNETKLSKGSVLFYDKVIFPISRVFDQVCFRWLGKNASMVCSLKSELE